MTEQPEDTVDVRNDAPTEAFNDPVVTDPPAGDMIIPASEKDMNAVLDAVKELTKVVAELNKSLTKHMTAGKF